MRLFITASLAVFHMRLANWHFQRGEALMWRFYAMSDPRRPGMTPAALMTLAALVGLGIGALAFWFAWRAS